MNGCTVFRRGHRQQHKQHKPRKQINQKITKTPISPTFPKRALEQDRVCNSQCLKTRHLRILIYSFGIFKIVFQSSVINYLTL